MGEELGHTEDEEHDARLLLRIVLRHDEEGRLHVDHGQTVPHLTEEEGNVSQHALGIAGLFGDDCCRHCLCRQRT